VTDANESLRQDVKQESPNELLDGDAHRSHLVAASIVPPTEGDVFAIKGNESVIGDGNTVGVAAKVADDLLWPAEGRFGINISYPSFIPPP
jgi:hypothetical protein